MRFSSKMRTLMPKFLILRNSATQFLRKHLTSASMLFVLTALTTNAIAAESAEFSINVSINFISLTVKKLDGTTFISFRTDSLYPEEVFVTDSMHGIWLDNSSNVPVQLAIIAFDDTAFCAPALPWNLHTFSGIDTVQLGAMIYDHSRAPNFADNIWLDETILMPFGTLAPGSDRFAYFAVGAPADTAIYGDMPHRLRAFVCLLPE